MTASKQPQQEKNYCEHWVVCKHAHALLYCPVDATGKHHHECEYDTRSRPHPAPATGLNTQPKECTCEDCQRFRHPECPYPDSNITMDRCCAFMADIVAIEQAATRKAREDALNEFMKAIEHRFEDTNNGRGVVGTIRGLKESLRQQEERR